jgi:hypothetical protein
MQATIHARVIYNSNEEETLPNVFLAFKEGTYHNVVEFWDLWVRLRGSLWRAVLEREREAVSRVMGNEAEEVPEMVDGMYSHSRPLSCSCVL